MTESAGEPKRIYRGRTGYEAGVHHRRRGGRQNDGGPGADEKQFELYGTKFYYVELIAQQQIRLQRNVTENRLKNKPSKRDIEASNQRLLNDDSHHRCVSREGEITFDNYLRIENSGKEPEAVARMIKDAFGL